MSPVATLIQNQINEYISNYALDAFSNLNLNRILNLILALADANSTGGGQGSVLPVTSANFTNATECPLSNYASAITTVYWEEGQRFLKSDAGEIQQLPGGGFQVMIANFNSATANYHFYVFQTQTS